MRGCIRDALTNFEKIVGSDPKKNYSKKNYMIMSILF
jgi:hypothetical protein